MDLIEQAHAQKHVWKTIDLIRELLNESISPHHIEESAEIGLILDAELCRAATLLTAENQYYKNLSSARAEVLQLSKRCSSLSESMVSVLSEGVVSALAPVAGHET